MNVSYAAKQALTSKMSHPDITTFDECHRQVFDLMKFDSMLKFKATPAYKEAKGSNSITFY